MANTEKKALPSAPVPSARAFNKELAPAYIDHVCIAHGFAPPPGSPVGEGMGAGFSYCELHCGSAVTATLLAASNPLGEFHALDPRGTALAQARSLAKAGGVKNISFHQIGVEESLGANFGPFDYIIVNGIYTWVPLRERALILSFVRKFLKPGGAVYVSYNARPGWNRLDPFRRIFREASRGLRVDTADQLRRAQDIYVQLANTKAASILATGVDANVLAQLDSAPLEAIAADYANEFADPLYVTDVASDFAAIDCVLAGASDIAESVPVLAPHEPFKSLFEKMPTQAGRELVKDFLRDTRLRRDVFVRGGRRLAADNRDMVLNGLAFALEQTAPAVRYKMAVPFGIMEFDNPHSRALVAALAEGPRTLGQLIEAAHARGADAGNVVANVHALLVTSQIRPVHRPTREAAKGAHALQDAIRARAATADAIGYLPSAVGTAFAVPVADQMFMALPAQTPAESLAAAVTERLGENAAINAGLVKAQLARRARAYKRATRYYAPLGLMPDVS